MTLAALPGWLKPSGHDTLLIDGKAVAATLVGSVRDEAATLPAGLKPGLAVVLVGDDPASAVYVRSKSWMAADCGFHSIQHTLPATTGEAELLALVGRLNADPTIHGILVQLPLPPTIDPVRIVESIAPEKDVDGLHPVNAGLLAIGDRRRALVPCTPAGCSVLIERTAAALDYKVAGRRAVVIGRSNLVGKPIAQLLLADNCTVTIAHRYTRDLRDLVGEAEILIVAIGQPEAIDGGWIRPGALVIDVGVNRVPHLTTPGKTRLVGDVALDKALGRAAAITPVPGGVGPMTIAMLMANTLTACKRAAG